MEWNFGKIVKRHECIVEIDGQEILQSAHCHCLGYLIIHQDGGIKEDVIRKITME